MGLFEVLIDIAHYFWPSQQQILEMRTQEAFMKTGLLLIPASRRDEYRKALDELEMPQAHREKGERILAELNQCRHPSQKETDCFLSYLGELDLPKDADKWIVFGDAFEGLL